MFPKLWDKASQSRPFPLHCYTAVVTTHTKMSSEVYGSGRGNFYIPLGLGY